MTPTAQAAVAAVADAWDQPEERIKGKERHLRFVVPRFFAWLLLDEAGWTIERIGKEFDRDHTTIINGLCRARKLVVRRPYFEKWEMSVELFISAQEQSRVRALPRFYRHGHFQEATE